MIKKFIVLFTSIICSYNTATASNRLYNDAEIKCLASNIYHESKGESLIGKAAVGIVVINRVKDPRWPKSVCGVVKQTSYRSCQFSWYCRKVNRIDYDSAQWKDSYSIAKAVFYTDEYKNLLNGATHFHSTSVRPEWADRLKFIKRIDNHMFYKQY